MTQHTKTANQTYKQNKQLTHNKQTKGGNIIETRKTNKHKGGGETNKNKQKQTNTQQQHINNQQTYTQQNNQANT